MTVSKDNLIAVAMIVVVIVAYFAQKAQNEAARDADRQVNVRLCVAGVERAAYIANGFRILSSRVGARANPGDKLSAANYVAVSESIVRTFPGIAVHDSRVDRVESSTGKVSFRLPQESKGLELKGCRQAFK